MGSALRLFPVEASTLSGQVDALYVTLVAISAFFSVLIAGLVILFTIQYRRRSETELPAPIHGSMVLELAWTIVPLMIVTAVFLWSAEIFVTSRRVPAGAMQVNVVAKRWMWKLQHMTGQREINELHVPVGTPVELVMTSEDVIHSFFVPAFRLKQDVVPGRYTTAWFQATTPGTYHLFCAEYCGTKHSGMIGSIVVMEPAAFQAWLAGGVAGSPVEEGRKLFESLACVTCHRPDAQGRGPRLDGIFGQPVRLSDGSTVVADADYVRESILNPTAKIVSGYQPIMPTFQGLVSEDQMLQLIAYIQSLQAPEGTEGGAAQSQGGGAAAPRKP